MTQKDQKFHEMRIAAEKSGLDLPGGTTLDELERIWDDLEAALLPPESAHYQVHPGHPAASASAAHEQPVKQSKITWIIGAGIAALLAFGFLITQTVMMRTTIEDMQSQVNGLEFALMQSSLQSNSAAERIDGLLRLASARNIDPPVLKSIVHRMTLDPNTNVRLASVKVLAGYADQPEVQTWLEDAAMKEESTLVVLEILSILWKHDMPRAESLWGQLQQEGRFDPIVQQQPEQV